MPRPCSLGQRSDSHGRFSLREPIVFSLRFNCSCCSGSADFQTLKLSKSGGIRLRERGIPAAIELTILLSGLLFAFDGRRWREVPSQILPNLVRLG
jgi:hypothetical protein